MPFTGKATFSAGSTLPDIAEDVSDIVSIVSPFETPLLDHLGDPRRAATSTVHEWLEDSLLPNTDQINQASFTNPLSDTSITVLNGSRFRVGDQIRMNDFSEILFVTAVTGDVITVVRGYGGTTPIPLGDSLTLHILGNAALEGADRPATRFTNRIRNRNFTQIFTQSVEVSGSQLAAQSIGIDDELDFQKQERIRELLRDLENCVVNGVASDVTQQGSSTVRRTMNGLLQSIVTNQFLVGIGPIPNGSGLAQDLLDQVVLNAAIRAIWEQSSAVIDTILVGGVQKRQINAFIGDTRSFSSDDVAFHDLVSTYSSDFGVARVILSRWVPSDAVILLDSSRIDVLPLAGRSFNFKRLASSGDSEIGQVIGEYTLEMRNENAHAVVRNLGSS